MTCQCLCTSQNIQQDSFTFADLQNEVEMLVVHTDNFRTKHFRTKQIWTFFKLIFVRI